jgi:hypothetical protein
MESIHASLTVSMSRTETLRVLEQLTISGAAITMTLVPHRANPDSDHSLIAQSLGKTFERVLCASATPSSSRSMFDVVYVDC